LGAFKKAFAKKPYDQLYHLYLWIVVEGKNITLEKNEVITMDIDASVRNGSDTMKVPLPDDRTLTLNELMANTEAMMKQKFLKYSAKDNNCQDFVIAVLKSNGLGDESIYAFVKQDTTGLFANDNFLRKVSNTLTDVGARANTAIFGAGKGRPRKVGGNIIPPTKDDPIGNTLPNRRIIPPPQPPPPPTPDDILRAFQAFNPANANPQREANRVRANARRAERRAERLQGSGIEENKESLAKIKSPVKVKNTMANKWIEFVKAYAKDKGIKYSEALKDPECKALYKKGGGFWKDFAKGFTKGFTGVFDLASAPVGLVNPSAGKALSGVSKTIRALAGGGMPTNQEAYIADLYDSINLGANAGKRRSK